MTFRSESSSLDLPGVGRATLLPWDEESLGVPVASLSPLETGIAGFATKPILRQMQTWAAENRVQIIAAALPSSRKADIACLQEAGFRYVDTALTARYDLTNIPLTRAERLSLTPAAAHSAQALAAIAGRAFAFGRYHADPRVPKEAADRRYRDWVMRAFQKSDPQIVLRAAHDGATCGFSIVRVDNAGAGHITLIALDADFRGRQLGGELIQASLLYLRDKGCGEVFTKISAANLAILNMHAHLGASFIRPEATLHWHTAESDFLLPLTETMT